jgi:chromosome segregation ATPase
MSEILDQLDALPEVITPEQEQAPMSEAEQAPIQSETSKEEGQDKNWKAARARMEEQSRRISDQERHIDLLTRDLQQLRHAVPKQEEPEEDISEFTESEKRLYREIKSLKGELHQTKAKESTYVVDRLRAKYTDFDEVVTPENIEYLKTNNAALAKALGRLQDDPYEQGLAAYDALKTTEWYKQRHTMHDKAKVETNSKKPMSVQSVRKQGALSEANTFANGLTPELKKQLLKEMADSRKGA